MRKEWESFREGIWEKEINVRDFHPEELYAL